VEREREIRAFVPEEYWQIEALLAKQNPPEGGEEDFRLRATLEKMNGEKINVADQENAAKIVADLEKATYKISDVQEKQRRRTPQPPFTTSKLQQDSFNRLRFPASKTMRIAQQLYEGVDLGAQGSVGLITYMRTDSVRVADSAVEEVRAFIRENCGEKYLPKSANKYKSGKKAQEAHEAIRPTSVTYTPDAVKPFLDVNQFKLYELIWRRFVASQMTPAVFLQTAVDIEADIYGLRSRGSVMLFDGFLKVYQEARDNDEILPKVEKGEVLDLIKLKPSQHFTKPPPRFTDASLVKVLEEKGIGRPSTYAPTIQTVVDRGYVRRDGGSLVPCELGETVIDLLIEHFSKVVDEGFTAEMEEEFDRVEEGSLDWVQVVREFYEPYSAELGEAKENMRAVRAEVEEMDEKCPDCGRPLVKKWGRGKKFISCSGFPDCKYARPITSGVPCPEEGCEGELVERWSRRGAFFGCSRFPTCRHISKELPKSDANAG
ncbi:MAG: type I DNA topoisomerase, partial [Candidatus Omnitrophica bacterium]|nr:type I DNA topoisomerase [Candidatus Omnitrophota bacterium]